jgi:hypothetical protein
MTVQHIVETTASLTYDDFQRHKCCDGVAFSERLINLMNFLKLYSSIRFRALA